MRGRWVLDTSPLLFLAKIDRLPVLRAAADELLVSPAVWEEIQARDDDATELVRGAIDEGWLELLPIGTLGILLAARLRGEIPSLREEVEKLQTSGFRVSPALVEAVLRSAGER